MLFAFHFFEIFTTSPRKYERERERKKSNNLCKVGCFYEFYAFILSAEDELWNERNSQMDGLQMVIGSFHDYTFIQKSFLVSRDYLTLLYLNTIIIKIYSFFAIILSLKTLKQVCKNSPSIHGILP